MSKLAIRLQADRYAARQFATSPEIARKYELRTLALAVRLIGAGA